MTAEHNIVFEVTSNAHAQMREPTAIGQNMIRPPTYSSSTFLIL